MDQPRDPSRHLVQLRVLGKSKNETPAGEFLQSFVDKGGELIMDARNWDVLHVKPSDIPLPNEFVGGKSWIYPLGAEHKRHASAVNHGFVLGLLLDSIKELPEADIRTNSEMTLAESREVGEEEKGVWAYVMRLEAISAKHKQEELGRWKGETALHPCLGEDSFIRLWSRSA
jgi:hypothetical protein